MTPISTRIDQDIARMADQMGVAQDKIRLLRPNWADLMRNGVIAQAHIHRFRGKAPLTYHDIGLTLTQAEADALKKTFKLGYKLLLPPDILNRGDALDSKARRELAKFAIPTHWGFFIPCTAYEEFKASISIIESEYYALRDEIAGSDAAYQQLIANLVQEYRLTAAATYGRLRELAPGLLKTDDAGDAETVLIDGAPARVMSVETFVDYYINSILAHVPNRETIYNTFHFELSFTYIPLPDLLAEQDAAATLIQETKKTQQAQQRAEREHIADQRRQEEFRQAAEREKISLEMRAVESAAYARERMLREMHQEVVSRARRNADRMITGFLEDVQGRLCNVIYDACVGVLEYTGQNNQMHPRKRVQLDNMIDQARRLAQFTGDADANSMIARIESELSLSAERRELVDLERVLRDIATVTRDQLLVMGQEPRSATGCGVPDLVDVTMLTASRSRLGLDAGYDIAIDASDARRNGRRSVAELEFTV